MNTESQILNVPIEDIIPNRFQPRLSFDDSALQELANSIKEHGIIQPLVLRRLGDKYEIIAGERRYKASKLAGLSSVPAIIANLNDKDSAEVAIIENVQRKDLTPIEEARSYKALLDKGYLTQEELARKMALSQSAIANKLRLLNLSENVQNHLMEGKISERHARSLLKISDFNKQDELANRVIQERLTVKDLDNIIKDIEDKKEVTPVMNINTEQFNNNDFIAPSMTQINEQPVYKPEPMPNKFFNFLEDEEVNMNTQEPTFNSFNDEVELLDFIAPVANNDNIDIFISNFVNDVKNKGKQVELEQKDDKYIITINK